MLRTSIAPLIATLLLASPAAAASAGGAPPLWITALGPHPASAQLCVAGTLTDGAGALMSVAPAVVQPTEAIRPAFPRSQRTEDGGHGVEGKRAD
ncbi:MAG: hypothetical protein AAFR79_07050 [Pseudomonadota bacterium]